MGPRAVNTLAEATAREKRPLTSLGLVAKRTHEGLPLLGLGPVVWPWGSPSSTLGISRSALSRGPHMSRMLPSPVSCHYPGPSPTYTAVLWAACSMHGSAVVRSISSLDADLVFWCYSWWCLGGRQRSQAVLGLECGLLACRVCTESSELPSAHTVLSQRLKCGR